MRAALLAIFLLAVGPSSWGQSGLPDPGTPGAINDPRYCGEPARTESGRIKRDRKVLREFARIFPCPVTLEPVPSCPGWAIDHTITLSMGGCDSIINLTWMPNEIKSCARDWCKDRWERIYHAAPRAPVTIMED